MTVGVQNIHFKQKVVWVQKVVGFSELTFWKTVIFSSSFTRLFIYGPSAWILNISKIGWINKKLGLKNFFFDRISREYKK